MGPQWEASSKLSSDFNYPRASPADNLTRRSYENHLDKEGQLKLGINDCTFTGDFGNFGSFSVVVSIVRGKSPE
jgi:hypothetical protein